jgi:capsular polysaccharide biosynthesis protein
MKGRLGAWDLLSNINQAVYVNNYTDAAVVSISVCNRNHLATRISIANTTSETSPVNAEWIEYDVEILGKGVLERTGIIVSPNHFLVVKSTLANVNAVVWGSELGDLIPIPVVIAQNT